MSVIRLPCQALDAKFHPQEPTHVLAGLVDGSLVLTSTTAGVEVTKSEAEESEKSPGSSDRSILSIRSLLPCGIRVVEFDNAGEVGFCGASDGTLCAVDLSSGGVRSIKKVKRKSGDDIGISSLLSMDGSRNMLFVGEDEGMIRLWDTRADKYVLKRHDHLDYVSGMYEHEAQRNRLFSCSADGSLGVWDVRYSSSFESQMKLKSMSHGVQDELQSITAMKGGRRVVCGSSEGVLNIFSSNDWSDISDRFPGHPHSVDAIVKIDEDTLLTGSSDGMIRVVQIQPNKLLGLAGQHGDLPIERLSLSSGKRQLVSCSHDEKLQLHDVSMIFHEDEDEEEEKDASENHGEVVADARNNGAEVRTRKSAPTNEPATARGKKARKRKNKPQPDFFDDL